MALEVLKDVREIGGFEVGHSDGLSSPSELMKPIFINHKYNSLGFRIQNGPIKENGVNGCQIQTLIETALLLVERHNERFPCIENRDTIKSLENAISFQKLRTRDRTSRGVEGTDKE